MIVTEGVVDAVIADAMAVHSCGLTDQVLTGAYLGSPHLNAPPTANPRSHVALSLLG
jgi:hypothetical protein